MPTTSEPHTPDPAAHNDDNPHASWFTSYEERELFSSSAKLLPCLDAGRATYKAKLAEIGDVGTCGFAWVVIEITPETKPAIRWLNEEGHGRLDGWTLSFKVYPNGFLQDDVSVQSLTVQEAGCEALAAALQTAGVPCRVESRVD